MLFSCARFGCWTGRPYYTNVMAQYPPYYPAYPSYPLASDADFLRLNYPQLFDQRIVQSDESETNSFRSGSASRFFGNKVPLSGLLSALRGPPGNLFQN